MNMLSGLVGLGVAYDRHWSSVGTILQAQAISIVLILLAAIPAYRDIQWSQSGTWLFTGGLLVVLVVDVWAFLASRRALLSAAQPNAG